MAPEFFPNKLPPPVVYLIDELRARHAEKVTGIFRLNGSDTKTKELIEELDHGKVNMSKYQDVHTLATALKRYFRAMAETEPLIPSDCYDAICEGIDKKDRAQSLELVKSISAEMERMSPARVRLLAYLFEFLHFVASHSDENKMTASNIAVCIAPNIIEMSQSIDQLKNSDRSLFVVGLMIEAFSELFPDFDSADLICTDEEIMEASAPPVSFSHIELQHLRVETRKNRIIPFAPPCKYSQKRAYRRPKRRPPPRVNDMVDMTVNLLDSLIARVPRASQILGRARKSIDPDGLKPSTYVPEPDETPALEPALRRLIPPVDAGRARTAGDTANAQKPAVVPTVAPAAAKGSIAARAAMFNGIQMGGMPVEKKARQEVETPPPQPVRPESEVIEPAPALVPRQARGKTMIAKRAPPMRALNPVTVQEEVKVVDTKPAPQKPVATPPPPPPAAATEADEVYVPPKGLSVVRNVRGRNGRRPPAAVAH